jgi:hypothetical protein
MFKDTVLSAVRSNWKRAFSGNLTVDESKYRTDGRTLVVASFLKAKQLEILSRPDEIRNNGRLGDEQCKQVIPDIFDGYERVYPVGFEPRGTERNTTKFDLAVLQASFSEIQQRVDAHRLVAIAKATGATKFYAAKRPKAVILHSETDEFIGLVMPVGKAP